MYVCYTYIYIYIYYWQAGDRGVSGPTQPRLGKASEGFSGGIAGLVIVSGGIACLDIVTYMYSYSYGYIYSHSGGIACLTLRV